MNDPQTTDLVAEGGKHVASGGVGMIALAFIQRFFRQADKDAGKLDQILAAVPVSFADASGANAIWMYGSGVPLAIPNQVECFAGNAAGTLFQGWSAGTPNPGGRTVCEYRAAGVTGTTGRGIERLP